MLALMVAVDCCTAKRRVLCGVECVWAERNVFGVNGSLGQDVSLGSDTKYDG